MKKHIRDLVRRAAAKGFRVVPHSKPGHYRCDVYRDDVCLGCLTVASSPSSPEITTNAFLRDIRRLVSGIYQKETPCDSRK